MKLLLILLLGWCSVASACESYEDCMTAPVNHLRSCDVQFIQARSLTAIAFKLDEISKKLDK